MKESHYQSVIRNAPFGYAYHEIILNADGKPSDYRFLEVNHSFELLTGLNATFIIGKTIKEIMPEIELDPFNWIQFYGKIAIHGGTETFEQFSTPLSKWYYVQAYSDKTGFFSTIFIDITSYKEEIFQHELTRKSLIKQETLLTKSQEIAQMGSWEVDLLTNELTWSDAIYQILELERDKQKPSYQKVLDLIHPDDVDAFDRAYRHSIATKTNYDLLCRLVLPGNQGNKIKYIHVIGLIETDENGTPIRSTGITQDISKQKRIEEKLFASEKRYRLISQTTTDFSFSCIKQKGDYLLEWISDSAEKISGYSETEILEKKCWQFMVHPEDISIFSHGVINIPPGENKEAEFRIICKSGDVKWLRSSTSCTLETPGSIHHLVGGCKDITDYKKADIQLKESEETFRKLYEDSSDPILLMKNRKFVACNMAAIRLLKIPDKEAILGYGPETISPEYQPDGRRSEESANIFINKAISEGLCKFEWEVMTAEGIPLLLEVTLMPIVLRGDAMLHVTWRDITARKQAEKTLIDKNIQLEQARRKAEESDQLKTAFLANVSHEIRTPMNGILGFLELLKQPNLTDEKKERYIDIVNKSGQRLLSTVNDIIELAKIESGQLEVFYDTIYIESLLKEQEEFFRQKAEEKSLILDPASLPGNGIVTIYSDRNKLEGILVNLLNNAIKFTDKGRVSFGCYPEDEKNLLFFVKDTGTGIPADRIEAIFDRFVQAELNITRAHEGSGLGLAICKAYVEKLGGRIWVESVPNKGSCFYFSLPVLSE